MVDHACAVLLAVEAVLLVPFIILDLSENSYNEDDLSAEQFFLPPDSHEPQASSKGDALRKVSLPFSPADSSRSCFQLNLSPRDLPGLLGGRDEHVFSYQKCKLLIDTSSGVHLLKCGGLPKDNYAIIPANMDKNIGLQLIFLKGKSKGTVRSLHERFIQLLPEIKEQLKKRQSSARELRKEASLLHKSETSSPGGKVTMYYIEKTSAPSTCNAASAKEKLREPENQARFETTIVNTRKFISGFTAAIKQSLLEIWQEAETALLENPSKVLDVQLLYKVAAALFVLSTVRHCWLTGSMAYWWMVVMPAQSWITARVWCPLQHLVTDYSPAMAFPVAVASIVQFFIVARDPWKLAAPGRLAVWLLEYPALMLLMLLEMLLSCCVISIINMVTGLVFTSWYLLDAAKLVFDAFTRLLSLPVLMVMVITETIQASALFCLGPCAWLLGKAAHRVFRYLRLTVAFLDRLLSICSLPALFLFSGIEIVHAATALLMGAILYFPAAVYQVFIAVTQIFLIVRPCFDESADDILDDCALHQCNCTHIGKEAPRTRRSRRLGTREVLKRRDVGTPTLHPPGDSFSNILRRKTRESYQTRSAQKRKFHEVESGDREPIQEDKGRTLALSPLWNVDLRSRRNYQPDIRSVISPVLRSAIRDCLHSESPV